MTVSKLGQIVSYRLNTYKYMIEHVYNFSLDVTWQLIHKMSQLDRFDAQWTTIEKREGQSLKQLKSIATVRSVGASTRIEGSKMTNEEVENLLKNLSITKLIERDQQEVAGYFEVLDIIGESYNDIHISIADIKNLHNLLLKHSEKDSWHKGDYKQVSNSVQATLPDGTQQIIFQTTEPGYPTEEAMRNLVEWYNEHDDIHPLVRCAAFVYEFVSIHPFQDGNGRMSRLLSTLLILKNGYKWIQYVSFEHEIESRKTEYYRALRSCQAERPNENISVWVDFFLRALANIQEQLMRKLETQSSRNQLSARAKAILLYIENHPDCRSGQIAAGLGIPSSTVKRILSELYDKHLVSRLGDNTHPFYEIV